MKKAWKILGYIGIGCIGIWLTAKFLLPIGLPFFLGWLLANLAEPPTKLLCQRLHFPRWLAALISILIIFLFVGSFGWLLLRLLVQSAQDLGSRLPELLSSLSTPLENLHERLLLLAAKLPNTFAPAAIAWIDQLFAGSSVVVDGISQWLISFAADLLSRVPNILLFLLTMLLSSYLIASERKKLGKWVSRQLSKNRLKQINTIKNRLKSTLGGYVKAQLRLSAVTFLILVIGFLLLKRDNWFMLALLVSLVDALPVFGAGTILIPWALLSFLQGDSAAGIGLALLYATASILRTFLEPKFIGKQIGLDPLLTLIALYAGFRLFGILGMILLPVAVILLKQLYDLFEGTKEA